MFLWYRAALVFSRPRRRSQEKNLTLEGRAQDQIVLAAGRRDSVERSKEYPVRLLYGRGWGGCKKAAVRSIRYGDVRSEAADVGKLCCSSIG